MAAFSTFRRGHGRSRPPMRWTFLAFALAGCVGAAAPETPEYAGPRAEQVIAKAYGTIYDKYIEQVSASDLGLRGITGLTRIDPAFKAQWEGDLVRLALGEKELDRFTAPASDDSDGWAQATARAIEAARADSPLLAQASGEEIYRAVINTAIAPLDRHTRYAGLGAARDYRAQREGFGGVGLRLNFDRALPQIIKLLPDSPAEGSDLRPGDVIVRIDDAPIEGIGRDAVIERLRGEVGSPVTLTVTREGAAEPLTVALKRGLVVSPTVELGMHGEFAVITLSGFNQRTGRNLRRVLGEIDRQREKPKGIILDLRGNPGGLLDQAVIVADAFLGRGRIVSTRGRHPDSFQMFNATGRDGLDRLPMAVLINGQSASASEIVAAALQDHGRAVVVGSNSYGKGSVQNITRLPNQGELILTWSRFHAPSGYALDNLGVVPNFCTNRPQTARPLPVAATAPVAEAPPALAELAAEAGATLAVWRAHTGYDAESVASLRARCPRRTDKPEEDLRMAERVLADTQLYVRAISVSQPVLARSH